MTTDQGLRTTDQKAPLITTYLEMRSPEQLRPKRVASDKWRVTSFKKTGASWRFNRDMYFRVGEQWQWIDKRPWTDEQWKEYVAAPEMRTFAAYYDDALAGYYELRQDTKGGVEIAYFGLLPGFVGHGYGKALLSAAVKEAWRFNASRVWLHTSTLDHPSALPNYLARGFTIVKVEEYAVPDSPDITPTERLGKL